MKNPKSATDFVSVTKNKNWIGINHKKSNAFASVNCNTCEMQIGYEDFNYTDFEWAQKNGHFDAIIKVAEREASPYCKKLTAITIKRSLTDMGNMSPNPVRMLWRLGYWPTSYKDGFMALGPFFIFSPVHLSSPRMTKKIK